MRSREGSCFSHQFNAIILPGVLLFAANSIGVCSLFAASHLELPESVFRVTSCWPTVALAQGTLLAIIAALIPMRCCLRVPLLVSGFCIQVGTIGLAAVATENATAYYPFAILYVSGFLATALFVLLVPVRCLLAARLEIAGGNRPLQPLQFSLGDILEWSTAVAMLLGVFHWLQASSQEKLHIPAAITVDGLLAFAFGIPVIAIVLAERKSNLQNAATVFWIAFVTVIHLGWIRMTRRGNETTLLWEIGVLPDVLFIATVAANALVLRWLGFRYNWGQRLSRKVSEEERPAKTKEKLPSPLLVSHR